MRDLPRGQVSANASTKYVLDDVVALYAALPKKPPNIDSDKADKINRMIKRIVQTAHNYYIAVSKATAHILDSINRNKLTARLLFVPDKLFDWFDSCLTVGHAVDPANFGFNTWSSESIDKTKGSIHFWFGIPSPEYGDLPLVFEAAQDELSSRLKAGTPIDNLAVEFQTILEDVRLAYVGQTTISAQASRIDTYRNTYRGKDAAPAMANIGGPRGVAPREALLALKQKRPHFSPRIFKMI